MVTAKLVKWQALFEQVKTHKRLVDEALERHSRGEGPFPTELKRELALLQRDAISALGEAADAVEAQHTAEKAGRASP